MGLLKFDVPNCLKGSRVSGLGVEGLGWGVLGFRVWGLGSRVLGFGV